MPTNHSTPANNAMDSSGKPIYQDQTFLQVSKETFQHFPPTFICHATEDPDVPFREALFLKRMLPQKTLVSLPVKAHDFDQQVTKESLELYQKVLEWLSLK